MELLVVLAIIALLAAALVVGPSFSLGSFKQRATADTLAAALKDARALAVRRNEEVALVIDTEQKSYGLEDEPLTGEISAELEIVLTIAETESLNEHRGAIRFFPDQTSTGGLVALISKEERLYVFVDWLTGRISVLDQESEKLPAWLHAS